MRKWLKAAGVGLGSYLVLRLLLIALAPLGALLLLMWSPRAVGLMAAAGMGQLALLVALCAALFGAGWAASMAAENREALAGLLAGGLIAVLEVPLGLLTAARLEDMPSQVAVAFTVVAVPGFATLGGWVGPRLSESKDLRRLGRTLGTAGSYVLLLWGTVALVSLGLVSLFRSLDPVQGQIPANEASAQARVFFVIILIAAFGAALGAYLIFRINGWKRRYLRHPLALALLLFGVVWGAALGYKYHVNRPRVVRLQEIAAEYNTEHAVPEHENAAPLYAESGEMLGDCLPRHMRELMGRSWRDEDYPDVAAWLDAHSEALELAVDASRRKSAFLPLPVPQECSTSCFISTDLERIRNIACVLNLQAGRDAARGDPQAALTHIDAAFRAGKSLERHSFLGLVVGTSVRNLAVSSLSYVLRETEPAPTQLRLVVKQVAEWRRQPYAGPDVLRDVLPVEVAAAQEELVMRLRGAEVFSHLMIGLVMLHRGKLILAWNRDLAQLTQSGSLREMAQKSEQFKRRTPSMFAPWQFVLLEWPRPLYVYEFPSVQILARQVFSQRARLCIVQAYAAALLYRADHGAPPEKWADLVPEYLPDVPADPFADGPLKLQHRDGRVFIYSVGPDGKDDGGSGYLERAERPEEGKTARWVAQVQELPDDFGRKTFRSRS